MSNERYLIVSYFVSAVACSGLGVVVYLVLRKPFGAIADAIAGKDRASLLKRALTLTLTVAGLLGFLGYSYNQQGCTSYEQVIKNRATLVDANVQQVQGAVDWLVWTVLLWGVLVIIGLKVLQKRNSGRA